MIQEKNRFPFSIIILLVFISLWVSLFNHWETGGESWGYWTFARIFSQTGTFIIPDRSPAYILYLNLFLWLGYPREVIAEYLVSTLITAVSLVVLFRRYLSWQWLTLAVILWIPFLQTAEPPVMRLALASTCFAVALREAKPSRFGTSLSYALLVLAYMFRSTYVICLGVFLFWDLIGIIKKKVSLKEFLPVRYDWPIFIVISLMIWFHAEQSPHRWNNTWLGSPQWTASKAKSLTDQGFIGNYALAYIDRAHGSPRWNDIYFIQREVFGGATTMLGVMRANPHFVLGQLLINVKNDLITGSKFTLIPYLFDQRIPQGSLWWYPIHLFITLPMLGIVLYGGFRGSKTGAMRCFFVANILMIAVLILALPKARYMHPMIPVLLLSTSWYAAQIRGRGHIGLILLTIILFSRGGVDWMKLIADVSKDIPQGTVHILRSRPNSIDLAKPQIVPLVSNCRGIISLEHTYWAAFSNIPVDKFYDIWEIPPFGSLGHSPYDGLKTDRIDCVIVSDDLKTSTDSVTNARIRYEYYIKPYVEHLKSLGAKSYEIVPYGTVTVLGK